MLMSAATQAWTHESLSTIFATNDIKLRHHHSANVIASVRVCRQPEHDDSVFAGAKLGDTRDLHSNAVFFATELAHDERGAAEVTFEDFVDFQFVEGVDPLGSIDALGPVDVLHADLATNHERGLFDRFWKWALVKCRGHDRRHRCRQKRECNQSGSKANHSIFQS